MACELRLARRPAPGAAPRRIGRQLRGPLQERRRRGDATPRRGPVGRSLQFVGDGVVGAERGVGAVPCAPIGIGLRVGRLGERAVDLAAVVHDPRRGRRPSASAGGGSAPGCRSRSVPRPRRARRRRVEIPSCVAARISSALSPTGSAAAASSSRWVVHREATDPPQEALLDVARPAARAGAAEPALVAAGSRGSSSSARGLPRASATIRSRTRSSRRPRMTESSSARASPSDRPRIANSGKPVSSSSVAVAYGEDERHGSASRRRATKASVCAETRSSHCASSMTQISGWSSVASASRLNTARPTRKRSGAAPRFVRTPCQARRAAGQAGHRDGPASARTTGAGRRTRVRRRLRHRSLARPEIRRALGRVFQQGGLADTRLAAQNEDLALSRASGRDQAIQRLALVVSAAQALCRIGRPPFRTAVSDLERRLPG